jgi:hypothetical protein
MTTVAICIQANVLNIYVNDNRSAQFHGQRKITQGHVHEKKTLPSKPTPLSLIALLRQTQVSMTELLLQHSPALVSQRAACWFFPSPPSPLGTSPGAGPPSFSGEGTHVPSPGCAQSRHVKFPSSYPSRALGPRPVSTRHPPRATLPLRTPVVSVPRWP